MLLDRRGDAHFQVERAGTAEKVVQLLRRVLK
jgi:hypothetical protein